MSKKKKSPKTPRKRLTSERPLKNRPADHEPPEQPPTEGAETTGDDDQELLKTPGNAAKRGPGRPRQPRLPTMEDPEIEELESAAEEYADIRDQRMELTPIETKLKSDLLALMKKHSKTSYVHDGFDIRVIVESEKVRVRIKKDKD